MNEDFEKEHILHSVNGKLILTPSPFNLGECFFYKNLNNGKLELFASSILPENTDVPLILFSVSFEFNDPLSFKTQLLKYPLSSNNFKWCRYHINKEDEVNLEVQSEFGFCSLIGPYLDGTYHCQDCTNIYDNNENHICNNKVNQKLIIDPAYIEQLSLKEENLYLFNCLEEIYKNHTLVSEIDSQYIYSLEQSGLLMHPEDNNSKEIRLTRLGETLYKILKDGDS